jgi:hypothetical protein
MAGIAAGSRSIDPTGRRAHGTRFRRMLLRVVLAAAMPIGIIFALLSNHERGSHG